MNVTWAVASSTTIRHDFNETELGICELAEFINRPTGYPVVALRTQWWFPVITLKINWIFGSKYDLMIDKFICVVFIKVMTVFDKTIIVELFLDTLYIYLKSIELFLGHKIILLVVFKIIPWKLMCLQYTIILCC